MRRLAVTSVAPASRSGPGAATGSFRRLLHGDIPPHATQGVKKTFLCANGVEAENERVVREFGTSVMQFAKVTRTKAVIE